MGFNGASATFLFPLLKSGPFVKIENVYIKSPDCLINMLEDWFHLDNRFSATQAFVHRLEGMIYIFWGMEIFDMAKITNRHLEIEG